MIWTFPSVDGCLNTFVSLAKEVGGTGIAQSGQVMHDRWMMLNKTLQEQECARLLPSKPHNNRQQQTRPVRNA